MRELVEGRETTGKGKPIIGKLGDKVGYDLES